MQVGDHVSVTGCITQDKFLRGRTLRQMEQNLGFHAGRLRDGAYVVALRELPRAQDFAFAGYSQVATHRTTPGIRLNEQVAKANVMAGWSLVGPGRLVKVLAAIRHNPDMELDAQYPPGHGVPQWDVLGPHRGGRALSGRVVAVVRGYPHAVYQPQG